MAFDFDRVPSRKGTHSLRWDTVEEKFGEPDLIPLTTADMDFPAPPCVRETLARAVEQGVYGYPAAGKSYTDAVVSHMARDAGWEIAPEWLCRAPGVVNGVAYALQSLTQPGDGILLPSPMYHPFAHLIEDNGRRVVRSSLRLEKGHYELDWADLEAKAADPAVTMLIFCTPHNPCGRVFTREELERVARLCRDHHLILIADEIHAGFCWPGHPFVSMGQVCHGLGSEYESNLVLCTSASKSYNLAGLQTSDIIIPCPGKRSRYQRTLQNQHLMSANLFGILATESAYNGAGEWLSQLRDYLWDNCRYLLDFFRDHVPGIVPLVPEATYMVWLDCRGLNLSDSALEELFIHKAKVGVNLGHTFGPEGTGFVRLNFATPRATLAEACRRIAKAVEGLA